MWGVERDPRASLGRREAHEDALVGVFGAVLVAAVESLRGSLAAPWAPWGSPSEFMASRARPWASHGRVWAVERDHMVPLGKREPRVGGHVVF